MTNCQECGACCATSATWPIFTTDADDEIDLIQAALLSACGRGMRCVGPRCSALVGEVGALTACSIYGLRPDVCRTCQPGDEACAIARRGFGLPAIQA